MRYLRWISLLTILALLCAMVPASLAEDFAVDIEEEDFAEEAVEEVDSLDLSDLLFEDEVSMPENNDLDLFDASLYEAGGEEQVAPAVAANASSGFEIDEDGVLVEYTGFDKNVVIPNSVTAIDDYAFQNDTTLETVTIPNSVTYIGGSAFSECEKLKSISIPSSVTEIGENAFYDCDSLKSVTLSKGIKTIESYTFSSCDILENLIIPDSVTSIKSYAFSGCSKLESITLPSSVASIARNAFDGSESLIIRGVTGSYAEKYANGSGIPFNAPYISFDEETEWCEEVEDDNNAVIIHINESRALKTIQKPTDLATTLKWSTSNTKIATVDQNGVVKGIANGTAIITAAASSGNGNAAQIKIYVPEPSEIDIGYGEDEWEVAIGETEKITVQVWTPYSYNTKANYPVKWSVSDSSILSITDTKDNSVSAKGLKAGKVILTATTSDGGKDTISVEVYRPDPESVTIKQAGPIQLHPGDKYTLNASVSPAAADQTISWYSYDTDIATVSKTGIVTAIDEGETTICADARNEYSAYIDIVVTPLHPHPTKVQINQKSPLKLKVGKTATLTTSFTPTDAAAKLTWESSDTDIATVSKTGVITAKEEGETRIYVETDNECEAYIDVEVLPLHPHPTKIKIDQKGPLTLKIGKKTTLTTTLTPKDAAAKLTWYTYDTDVVKVSKTGVVTAVSSGEATIWVETDNGCEGSIVIRVPPVPPTKVKLNRSKATVGVSDILALSVSLLPKNASSDCTITSSNPKIISVGLLFYDGAFLVAHKKGKATITVETDNGKKAKCVVTVKAAPKKVTLYKGSKKLKNKQTLTLKKGKTLKLKAKLPAKTAASLTWTSSKPTVATVDENGRITALKPGTTTITVKTHNKKTAKVKIKVK